LVGCRFKTGKKVKAAGEFSGNKKREAISRNSVTATKSTFSCIAYAIRIRFVNGDGKNKNLICYTVPKQL
jgi:hypothetical protein